MRGFTFYGVTEEREIVLQCICLSLTFVMLVYYLNFLHFLDDQIINPHTIIVFFITDNRSTDYTAKKK